MQTDSQLTQGSASLIHTVPNAPVGPLPTVQAAPTSSQGVYNVAQYTPSAQEAATGAYSAPSSKLPAATVPAAARCRAGKTASRRNHNQAQTEEEEPAGHADPRNRSHHEQSSARERLPAGEAAPPQQPTETQEENPAQTTTGTGLTDQELEQRNLPPLRGPWVRVQRGANPLSPREEAEMQLQRHRKRLQRLARRHAACSTIAAAIPATVS